MCLCPRLLVSLFVNKPCVHDSGVSARIPHTYQMQGAFNKMMAYIHTGRCGSRPSVRFLASHRLFVVTHTSSPGTPEVEAGDLGV